MVDEPVLNIDLAQTLIDYAGAPAPKEMQGRSWRPLLERTGSARSKDGAIVSSTNIFMSEISSYKQSFAVRAETSKLVLYPGHSEWTEAFN